MALGARARRNVRNFQRITAWLAVAGVFWIAGALRGAAASAWRFGSSRLRSNTCGPSVGFWVPGLGRSTTADWDVDGGHLAERCALFIIIALGESILVTGATFAD